MYIFSAVENRCHSLSYKSLFSAVSEPNPSGGPFAEQQLEAQPAGPVWFLLRVS